VQRQCSGEQNVAALREAEFRFLTVICDMSRHIGIGDPSKKMRAQGKFEGAIVWSSCIQMDAGEHHPLKKLNRRFDMPDPSLSRPVRIARDFNAFLDCDNAILMPR